jgi:hypothetical protein
MKKLILVMFLVLAWTGLTHAATSLALFEDNFQAYPTGDPADFSATGNWTWNGNGAGSNASRIFDTVNFGGTRLWIASAANAAAGSGIDSKGIDVATDTDYAFSAAVVCETWDGNRTATFTVDLRVGQTLGTSSSVIGGPQGFGARGDDADGVLPNSSLTYDDQRTEFAFNTGTVGAGDKLFIRIAFTGTNASNPFVGIDNVSISSLLAVDVIESGGSTDVTEGGTTPDSYDIQPLGELYTQMSVTITPDAQVTVNGSSSPIVLTFDPNVGGIVEPQTVTVAAYNDDTIESTPHTGVIGHVCSTGGSDPNYNGSFDLFVNVTDDDGDPGVVVSKTALWVGEGLDPNDVYTLVLLKPPAPGKNVTVTVNSGSQCNSLVSSVVFTSANWDVPQEIEIEALDDGVTEGVHFSTITHMLTSDDPVYASVTVPDVAVVIGDNEVQGPTSITPKPALWYYEDTAVNRYTAALAANGEEISVWEDQSGNRRYANGRDYYENDFPRFDAATNSADFALPSAILSTNNWDTPLAQPTTIFCVGSIRSVPYTGYFYDSLDWNDGGANRQILTAHGASGKWEIGAGVWQQTSPWSLGSSILNTITYNGDSSLQRVNGLEVFSGDLGTGAMEDGMVLGCRYSTANHLDGQISEIIVYGELLTPAEIDEVEFYLLDKWVGFVSVAETDGSTDVTERLDPNTDTYVVTINGSPTKDVDVTCTPDSTQIDLGNGPGNSIILHASYTDPNTFIQTVTVQSVDDGDSEGPHTATISHTVVSDDANYGGYDVDDVVVNITDDEAWCGQAGTVYFDADLNQDCFVDLRDFAIFASNWLRCTDPFLPVDCPPYTP